MGKVVVYSALFGSIDNPPPVPELGEPGELREWDVPLEAQYVLFSDRELDAPGWTVWVVPSTLPSRRQARECKIHSRKYFPKSDWTVWVDANVRLTVPMSYLICSLEHRKTVFLAMLHPHRRCLYDEIDACIQMGKDGREILERQRQAYQEMGVPKGLGLFDTSVTVRGKGELLENIETRWWAQLVSYSVRDQVSLPMVLWQMGCPQQKIEDYKVAKHVPHRS